MKTKLLICCLIVVTIISVLLIGCNKQPDTPDETVNNISYLQTGLYKGGNADFDVKILCGQKEVLFVADGKTNEVSDFCTLSVIPSSVDLFNYTYTYVINGDKGTATGTLDKDSFGAYFQSDFDMNTVGTPASVELSYNDKKTTFLFDDMMKDKIDGKQAMEIAENELKDKLTADNKEREIYVRMINNSVNPESEYFWYVAFISSPTDYYACLINPIDKSIVSCTK